MGLLIISQPGTVIAVTEAGDVPFPIAIQGWGGAATMKSTVTELSIVRQGNVSFSHTLKDLVYTYGFGERMGMMRIAGLSFAALCGTDSTTGPEALLNYYQQYRVANTGAPVTVAIGTSAAGRFRGFLLSMRLDVVRPEARLAQFGLEFATLPNS